MPFDLYQPIPPLLEIGLPVVHGRYSVIDAAVALARNENLPPADAAVIVADLARGTPIYSLDSQDLLGPLAGVEVIDPGCVRLLWTAGGREVGERFDLNDNWHAAAQLESGSRVWHLPRLRGSLPLQIIRAGVQVAMSALGLAAETAAAEFGEAMSQTAAPHATRVADGLMRWERRGSRSEGEPNFLALGDLAPATIKARRRRLSSR